MRVLVTGVGGLVGSAVALLAAERGFPVVGIDSNSRGRWFGAEGSVDWRLRELSAEPGITVLRADFRSRLDLVSQADLVVHCASQPSHDLSRSIVLEDSSLNYMGTVELLEAARAAGRHIPFAFLSTNKVYGDRINSRSFLATGLRFVLEGKNGEACECHGVSEQMPIDSSLHTPFGVSKLAGDLMVQEYHHSFGLPTVVFRCGCLTGPSGSPVEMQGFLGWLVRSAVRGEPYTVYGQGGYQVRDNLAAEDLAEAILLWAADPKPGVYNLGGGPENSLSVLEAIEYLRQKRLSFKVRHGPARLGDHRWWITNNRKFQVAYPSWAPCKKLLEVVDEMVQRELGRRGTPPRDEALPPRALGEAGLFLQPS